MHKKTKILILCICSLFLCCLCACSNSEKDRLSTNLESENFQEESVVSETEKVMEESATVSSNDEVIEQSVESEVTKKTLCSECKGKGFISCPPCGGTGRVQCQQCEGKGGNCTYCDGSGKLNCATCLGKGNIDCTACGGSGTLNVKETQENEEPSDENGIHPCPDCQGEGRVGICSNCGGSGYDKKIKQICIKCLSTGKNRCDRCDGYGMLDSNGNGVGTNIPPAQQTPNTPNAPQKESSKCWICHGDGKCNNCGGSGKYEFNPEWAGDSCRTCGGSGRCKACGGRGYIE